MALRALDLVTSNTLKFLISLPIRKRSPDLQDLIFNYAFAAVILGCALDRHFLRM